MHSVRGLQSSALCLLCGTGTDYRVNLGLELDTLACPVALSATFVRAVLSFWVVSLKGELWTSGSRG